MTEREMQELLWDHPDKLLNEQLTQFRWESGSAIGRADLIFTDRLGRLLIVEVKRGKLGREAIGQLRDYFGMVKREFQGKSVELMVVANSIPEERRLACENWDIECREIPEKKFRDVAEEVGYQFRSEAVPISSHDVIPAASRRSGVRAGFPRSFGNFDPRQYGYSLRSDFDRGELKRLLKAFRGVIKRDIDKSLAVKLKKELLERDPPQIERATLRQLARWCKTNNPLYWDGMDIARKISVLLFGQVVDREKLGT